jgi:hypothetical protein
MNFALTLVALGHVVAEMGALGQAAPFGFVSPAPDNHARPPADV